MPGKFPKRNYEPRSRKSNRPPPKPAAAPRKPEPPVPAAPTAWEQQAPWYDQLQGEGGDDFYSKLIIPAVLRQLDARTGERVLDVACGQGVLGRALAKQGIACLGVDASPSLIEAAKQRATAQEQYQVGDVRSLKAAVGDVGCDHAAAVMALQDLDPIAPVLSGISAVIKPGGRLVIVLSHPCFRIPKRSAWGWDEQWGIQYRRVDAYQSPAILAIKTHPGRPHDTSATNSFHRPLATYLSALGQAGFGVVNAEELCSHRRGTKGARYQAEDRAAKEIPVFLVLTAMRRV
jgi:2-polyprenyl-3-methyl-5-hydroxy-6-metoxy-1,4-benzoquinol methylase